LKKAIAIEPAFLRVFDVVVHHEDVCRLQRLKVADVRKEVRLHDDYFHRIDSEIGATFGDHIDARAEVGIDSSQFKAAVEVLFRDDAGLERSVELEIRQAFEHDAALRNRPQLRRPHVGLKRIQ